MEEIDLGGFTLRGKDLIKQIKDDLKDDWIQDPLAYEDMLSKDFLLQKLKENIDVNC